MSRGQEMAKKLVFDSSKKGSSGPQDKKLTQVLGNANFMNASKIGYLYKRAESVLRDWSEKFCVLTNVGLLYYNDPNERPHNLFPIIDSNITPVPYEKFKRHHVFLIAGFNVKIIFAAPSEEEYKSWMNGFKRLQLEFDKKRESQLAGIS